MILWIRFIDTHLSTNKNLLCTEYAGWAVTAGIAVKFGTAHGRSIPDVGSMKRIDVYGSGGVSQPFLVIGNSYQKRIVNSDILRTIQKTFTQSLTVCSRTTTKTKFCSHRLQH